MGLVSQSYINSLMHISQWLELIPPPRGLDCFFFAAGPIEEGAGASSVAEPEGCANDFDGVIFVEFWGNVYMLRVLLLPTLRMQRGVEMMFDNGVQIQKKA